MALAGARCDTCGVRRWYPPLHDEMPPCRFTPDDDVDVAASPEWFGDGRKASREILIRRSLAEMIATASQAHFHIREP
jgi:hypothetical protein